MQLIEATVREVLERVRAVVSRHGEMREDRASCRAAIDLGAWVLKCNPALWDLRAPARLR